MLERKGDGEGEAEGEGEGEGGMELERAREGKRRRVLAHCFSNTLRTLRIATLAERFVLHIHCNIHSECLCERL